MAAPYRPPANGQQAFTLSVREFVKAEAARQPQHLHRLRTSRPLNQPSPERPLKHRPKPRTPSSIVISSLESGADRDTRPLVTRDEMHRIRMLRGLLNKQISAVHASPPPRSSGAVVEFSEYDPATVHMGSIPAPRAPLHLHPLLAPKSPKAEHNPPKATFGVSGSALAPAAGTTAALSTPPPRRQLVDLHTGPLSLSEDYVEWIGETRTKSPPLQVLATTAMPADPRTRQRHPHSTSKGPAGKAAASGGAGSSVGGGTASGSGPPSVLMQSATQMFSYSPKRR